MRNSSSVELQVQQSMLCEKNTYFEISISYFPLRHFPKNIMSFRSRLIDEGNMVIFKSRSS